MIKIKQAWYVKQLPQHVVAELLDARLVMFRLTPFRKVGEAEFIPYLGHHPSKCTSSVVPGYVLKHYGLEAEPLLPTKETGGLTTLEAEREYDLPEGTVRRDIHRERFEAGEYQKVGRGWILSREAIERVYKKGASKMIEVVIIEAGVDYTDRLGSLMMEAGGDVVEKAIAAVEAEGYTVIPNTEGGQNELCTVSGGGDYIAITVEPK
jgi:hypothetical protein